MNRKYQDFVIEKIPQPQLSYIETHRSEWHNKNSFTNTKNLNLLIKNPGFIIKSQCDNRIILSIRIVKNKYSSLDMHTLGIYVIKIEDEDKYTIIYERVNKCYCPTGLISE
jgi:hypothetical protein